MRVTRDEMNKTIKKYLKLFRWGKRWAVVMCDTLLEPLSQARLIYSVNKDQLLVIDSVSYWVKRYVETL